MNTTETPAAPAPVAKPWTVIIYPDFYDDDDDHGYCWGGFATSDEDAIEQATRECEATNDMEEGELDADEMASSDCGPNWRTIAEQMAAALKAGNPERAASLFAEEGGPEGENYGPAERPRVEVYTLADGLPVERACWPLDLGVSLEACTALASNEMERRNAGARLCGVRVVGAADEIGPGEFVRAVDAGYTIEPNGFGAGFIAKDPEDDEIASGVNHPSERAAWEACDHHRRFGTLDGFIVAPDGETWKWKAVGVPGAMWSPPFDTREAAAADAAADLA